MDATKVRLSPEEAALLMRSDWILTKNRILQKVMDLLGLLQETQHAESGGLPEEVSKTGAKIFRGENYKGLPYLILDQPRLFTKEDVFAVRSFFWWGHFFSSTLQLAGSYKKKYEERIIAAFPLLQQQQFFICINEDPWVHDFEEGNFISLEMITADRFKNIITDHPFCKLSKKINLDQWDNAIENLSAVFTVYMELCGDQLPSR